MQRKTAFVQGEFYHLYNRGVDKRILFTSEKDYRRFILLLHVLNTNENLKIRDIIKNTSHTDLFKRKNKDPLVAIGAYCLMPNHFHLLITPIVDGGISKFMLKIQTAYSMYFNKKNNRSGALFQGIFKSQHANTDEYLRYLYSYIHLNPAKLKQKDWREKINKNTTETLRSFVATYPYSSIDEYLRRDFHIISPEFFPEYQKECKDEKEFLKLMIDDWLEYTDHGLTQGSPV